MSTFKEKIESYCSSTDNDTVLSDMLSSSAKEVLTRVPLPVLNRYSTNALVTDANGYDSTDKKVLSLNRSGYDVKEVGLGKQASVVDPNSIHLATKRTPVFFFDGKTIKAKPNPDGTDSLQIKFIAYPDVAVADTDITSLPSTTHEAVVLRASEKWLIRQIGVIRGTIPAALSEAAFSIGSLALPDITASPYNSLATVTYDASGNVTEVGSTTPASATDATKGTVDIPSAAPAYTPAGSDVAYDESLIGVNVYLENEEVELAQAALQKEAQRLQDYQIDTQNAQNEFQENVTHYQAEVQKSVQNAQATTQTALSNMQKDLSIAQQTAQTAVSKAQQDAQMAEARILNNKIQATQAIIANNNFLLSRFNTEMQVFQAEFGKQMQLWTTNFQKAIQQFSTNTDAALKRIQVLSAQIGSVKEMYQLELTRIAELT